jgi:hypothetical protein
MLVVGLLVGAFAGSFVGRPPGAALQADPPPVAVVPEAAIGGPSVPRNLWWADFVSPGLHETKPASVSRGMIRAEAVAALKAEGFEPWVEVTAADQYERFRKPWQGGYHFVNLLCEGGEVSEVYNFWNDP